MKRIEEDLYRLISAFPEVPDKNQAWAKLIQIMQCENRATRWYIINALESVFHYVSDKNQVWADLVQLTQDNDIYVRWHAVNTLILIFPHVPDKKQALVDMLRLTRDQNRDVQWGAVKILGLVFPQVPNKELVWGELHWLTEDKDGSIRWVIADTLGSAFQYIPDKEQAWSDLIRLTQDSDSSVQMCATDALGSAFPYITDKEQAWSDLIRLTKDENPDVRVYANHSLGRASIFKATDTKSVENFKEELEIALEFFERASEETYCTNPAKFCLPFYRSFYTLTFKKYEAEEEVRKYLYQARSAAEGSESKQKLYDAINCLSNALTEVQKTQEMGFEVLKWNLNAYRQYCEEAAKLLDTTEEKAPLATKIIRIGSTIIDQKIKEIIGEIQNRSKAIFNETKNTPLKEFGLKTCKQAQELSLQDPLTLGIGLGRMIDTARSWCEYIKQADKKKSACEKLNSLTNLGLSEQVIVFAEVFEFISKNLDLPRIQTVKISETQKKVIKIAVIQFCYELTKSFPPVIKNKKMTKSKIFSGLDLAKQNGANIICLPELCLCEEWIPEIKNKYQDIIIIGGGFYQESKNVCPIIIESDIDLPMQSKLTPSGFEDSEMWEKGMIPGDRIYKYETQFGKFVILICRDFENLVHYFRDTDIDFIFCPAFNPANDRFHQEANNHVIKTPSYILIANTGIYGGTSIFAQLNRNYFDRLVGEGCKNKEDLSYKLCEAKRGKDEVIIADFNLAHKAIQTPTPSEPSKEKRSVTHIKKLPIP